jgi:hypothetical protein
MNWIKCVYHESECICVFFGVVMHEDMHNNLVGLIKSVELRIIHSMQGSLSCYGSRIVKNGVPQVEHR